MDDRYVVEALSHHFPETVSLAQFASQANTIEVMTLLTINIAVSYTHLDVYKRQSLQNSIASPIPFTSYIWSFVVVLFSLRLST